MFNNVRLAFSFLTVFPLHVNYKDKNVSLPHAMVFFPVVGIFIALISLIMVGGLESLMSSRFVALLLVVLPIIFSGGLHVDGLADCFDAFFQGKDRDDILRVMKDSRIGVWGSLSVVFMVLIKWELLTLLSSRNTGFIFIVCLSRWAHVVICYLLPYARTGKGLGKEVAGSVDKNILLLSSICPIILSIIFGFKGVLILSFIFIYVLSRFYKKKIQGITGDVIGATGELVELFALFCMVIFQG